MSLRPLRPLALALAVAAPHLALAAKPTVALLPASGVNVDPNTLAASQEVMRGPSPLSPGLRELIAAFTSRRNDCLF